MSNFHNNLQEVPMSQSTITISVIYQHIILHPNVVMLVNQSNHIYLCLPLHPLIVLI
jgi:hypothetical protein